MKNLRTTPLLLLSFLFIGFASCKKAAVTPNKGKNLVLTSIQRQKVTADNAFSIKLFKNLADANTSGANLFVSPLSVSFALGMASNGAAGQTLAAFKNTLNFNGMTQDEINTYYSNLITNLPQLDPNTTLNIANSIWCKQGFNVLPQFLKTDSSYFHAQVQSLDFTSPSAVGTINNWVSSKTSGKIPTIIDQIPGDEKMYLINAIYFKSVWKEKFDPAQTQNQPFYLADNSTVQASFMNGTIDFNYYNDGKVAVYELPYSNSKYSLVILEPAYSTTLKDFTASLDSTKWQTYMSGLMATNQQISFPKFKFSYSVNLNKPLKDLGLGIAFSDFADFSNIEPTIPLQIDQVVHKAYVELDESGTTAAAATSVGIRETTAPAPAPPINHPFMFAIREMSSGIILFVGTVNDPTK